MELAPGGVEAVEADEVAEGLVESEVEGLCAGGGGGAGVGLAVLG